MPDASIAAIRGFNRFYTRQLGLLNEKLLNSAFTLTEARVLYELAQAPGPVTSTELRQDLVLDAGYLSRILKEFEARGLLSRAPDAHDGRQSRLAITPAGRAAFAPLDEASRQEIAQLIRSLGEPARVELISAMARLRALLGGPAEPIDFRPLRAGDLGWIAHRQMLIYADEYGWDGDYEVLAAEIMAGFVRNFDPLRERSWIAVRGDRVVGSVFVMRGPDTVAKLRLLYVEPEARGTGLGRHLVNECIAFATQAGYRTLALWTNDVLVPARRIYQAAGFACVKREPHCSFGRQLVGETWELGL